MRRSLLLALCLEACATIPPAVVTQPRPAAAPAPALPPEPVTPVAVDWKDRPFSNGIWTYVQQGDATFAQFGRSGANPDLLVACIVPRKVIRFSRAGKPPGDAPPTMLIASTDAERTYAGALANTPPFVWSETDARDRHLDALAFGRGRILVSVRGLDDLVIPAWPEFARVVEDCRAPQAPISSAMPQPDKSDAKIN